MAACVRCREEKRSRKQLKAEQHDRDYFWGLEGVDQP